VLKLISSRQALEWIAARGRLVIKSGLGETTLPDPPLELTIYMRYNGPNNQDNIILELNIVDKDEQSSEFDSDSD
jgi:hypothetical protein